MEAKEVFEIIREKFGDRGGDPRLEEKEPQLPVKPQAIREVCEFLRSDERLRFDYLNCISGLDMEDSLAVAYHMESLEHKHAICLKAEAIERDSPEIPSVAGVWPTANWHEREAYDLFGIVFEGHPDLKRILCAEDWVGYPLRKDYEFPQEYHGIPCEIEYMDRFEG